MIHRLTILFISFILFVTAINGQGLEPLELAKNIFSKDEFKDLHKFIAGDYEGHPNGQDLRSGSLTHFTLLRQTTKEAVVALTILDSTGHGLDTYLHFKKDSIWKMSAFRALAMTGIIEQEIIELENMTLQQVDAQIEQSKKSKNKDAVLFSSREDYYFELGNAKLILDLDDNIIKHFLANKSEFERIKDVALKELESTKPDEERSIKLAENLRNDYRKLFISSVSYGGLDLCSTCLDFLIGGMLDNSVGYLYVKDKKDLPEMNDSGIIMIKEIGNGWYIYKTT